MPNSHTYSASNSPTSSTGSPPPHPTSLNNNPYENPPSRIQQEPYPTSAPSSAGPYAPFHTSIHQQPPPHAGYPYIHSQAQTQAQASRDHLLGNSTGSNPNSHPSTPTSVSEDIFRRMAGQGNGNGNANGTGQHPSTGTSLFNGLEGDERSRRAAQVQLQQQHAQAQAHAQHTNGKSGLNGHGGASSWGGMQGQEHAQAQAQRYGYGGSGYGARYGGPSGKGYDQFPPFMPSHDPYAVDHLHGLANGHPSSSSSIHNGSFDPLHIDPITAAAVAGGGADHYISGGHGPGGPSHIGDERSYYAGMSGQDSRISSGSGASSVNGGHAGRRMTGPSDMAHLYASLHRSAGGPAGNGMGAGSEYGSAPPSRPHSAQGGGQYPPYYGLPRPPSNHHDPHSAGRHPSSFGTPAPQHPPSPSARHANRFDGFHPPGTASTSGDPNFSTDSTASPYGSPLGAAGIAYGSSAAGRKAKYTRSRTGCLACRTKRVKCDEARPVCKRCVNAKRDASECIFPGLADLPKSTIKAMAAAAAATAEAEGRPYQHMDGLHDLLASGGSGAFKRRRASDEVDGESKRSRTEDEDIQTGGHRDSTFYNHGPELMQHYMHELQQTLGGSPSRPPSPGSMDRSFARHAPYNMNSRDRPNVWNTGVQFNGMGPTGGGGCEAMIGNHGGGTSAGPSNGMSRNGNGYGEDRHFRPLSSLLASRPDE